MLRRFAIRNYRSLRAVELLPGDLTVITGANGAGKSNLYRALGLVLAAARGRFAASMVEDGGMPSALWAGDWKKDERRRIEVDVETLDWRFELACGLPPPPEGAFALDPFVKEERLSDAAGTALLERKGPSAWMRARGARARTTYPAELEPQEAALSQLREPHLYPDVAAAQAALARWRFYHHFDTGSASPIRSPQVGTRTPVLAADGRDLAAAVQTILEVGDSRGLAEAVDRAFPGAHLQILHGDGQFTALLQQRGFKRPFAMRELSDGTLRYLCLIAALLSPRPSPLLILNEPDQSLHPELAYPLSELVLNAAERSQLIVITHSPLLARLLTSAGARAYDLRLEVGATIAEEVA